MPVTYIDANGHRAIDKKKAFVAALNGRTVIDIVDFEQVFQDAEELILREYPEVTGGALSNSRGDWYEWLIAVGALEYRSGEANASFIISLPNIKQYDCSQLYNREIFGYIQDLRTKVYESANVRLITSNPDFVLIDNAVRIRLPRIGRRGVNEELINQIDDIYRQLNHACSLEQIIGYVAVKSSLRPDRRLQIAHEGSLMKALYRHIQTREWLIGAQGIKYHAITRNFSPADQRALTTVATHSIIDVSSTPVSAVDTLFSVDSGIELRETFQSILLN